MRATKSLILGFVVASAISIIGAQQPAVLTPASAVNGAGVLPSGATVGGTLFTSTTAVSTTDLLEDTLQSYSLLANALAVNGRGVRITAWGTLVANGNTKTLKLYFGSTVIGTISNATSGGAWRIAGEVLRSGAATQISDVIIYEGGFTAAAHTSTPSSETLSGAVLIKVTGQGPTTIGDITAAMFMVEAI